MARDDKEARNWKIRLENIPVECSQSFSLVFWLLWHMQKAFAKSNQKAHQVVQWDAI